MSTAVRSWVREAAGDIMRRIAAERREAEADWPAGEYVPERVP